MSKSFALVNGDLIIGPGRAFEVVSGHAKLIQDLSLWILERLGSDPATPTFGSVLDGGISNGVIVDSFIGQLATQEAVTQIRSEVIRLIENYQAMQYDKLRRETLLYGGPTTLDEDEIVASIDSITAQSRGTLVLVQVKVNTLSGSQVKLTLPVTGGSNA